MAEIVPRIETDDILQAQELARAAPFDVTRKLADLAGTFADNVGLNFIYDSHKEVSPEEKWDDTYDHGYLLGVRIARQFPQTTHLAVELGQSARSPDDVYAFFARAQAIARGDLKPEIDSEPVFESSYELYLIGLLRGAYDQGLPRTLVAFPVDTFANEAINALVDNVSADYKSGALSFRGTCETLSLAMNVSDETVLRQLHSRADALRSTERNYEITTVAGPLHSLASVAAAELGASVKRDFVTPLSKHLSPLSILERRMRTNGGVRLSDDEFNLYVTASDMGAELAGALSLFDESERREIARRIGLRCIHGALRLLSSDIQLGYDMMQAARSNGESALVYAPLFLDRFDTIITQSGFTDGQKYKQA